jgi:DNA-binding response OmpR family regulator
MRVLIVEDDRRLADVLRRGLEEESYTVDLSWDGDEAIELAGMTSYDAILLDVMLPGQDGLAVCRKLRSSGITAPILMLTARDTVDDTVAGLEAGADDYLTKPFAFRELRARLHTVMRRSGTLPSTVLELGDLVLDVATREARQNGREIALTTREYQILSYLMRNHGRVLTRTMIEDHVWGYAQRGFSNTVDVHIRRLRSKLDRPGEPSIIETVRGAGYRLIGNE